MKRNQERTEIDGPIIASWIAPPAWPAPVVVVVELILVKKKGQEAAEKNAGDSRNFSVFFLVSQTCMTATGEQAKQGIMMKLATMIL